MRTKKITLQNIADELNISKVTVHKALTNQSGVSNGLKERILKTAEELGYLHRSNLQKKCNHFLYIYPKKFFFASEPFYSFIYYHAEEECKKIGAEINLLVIDDEKGFESAVDSALLKSNFTGILVGGEIKRKALKYLESLPLPLVCIDFFSTYKANYVFVDNYHGSYYLTKYLIKQGHKNIGFIGNPHESDSVADRLFGYKKALFVYGLQFNPEYLIPHKIEHFTDLNEIILPAKLPTAYICHSDSAAYQLYMKLQVLGIRVPDDISVVSFDNNDLCTSLRPALTSSGVSKEQFAKSAINVMVKALSKPQKNSIYQPLYHTIFKRESVKEL